MRKQALVSKKGPKLFSDSGMLRKLFFGWQVFHIKGVVLKVGLPFIVILPCLGKIVPQIYHGYQKRNETAESEYMFFRPEL